MSLNEEKSPRFFVWEKRQGEVKGIQYAAAIYAEKPMTGMGTQRDNEKFVFVHEITPEENGFALIELINKYPAPSKPV